MSKEKTKLTKEQIEKKILSAKIKKQEDYENAKIFKARQIDALNRIMYYQIIRTNKPKHYDENHAIFLAHRHMQIEDTFELSKQDLFFNSPNFIMKKSSYYFGKAYGWNLDFCGLENKNWIVKNNEEYSGCGCFLIAKNGKYEINADFGNAKQQDSDKNQENYEITFRIFKTEKIIDKELQFSLSWYEKDYYDFKKYYYKNSQTDKKIIEIESCKVLLSEFDKKFCQFAKIYS